MTPALSLLLGTRAAEVLAAAVEAYGGRLDRLRPTAVHVQPSGAAAVRYAAGIRHDDGTDARDILVATTGDEIPAGAAVVAGADRGAPVEIGIWRWLHDPALPALAVAADPVRLAEMLRGAGLSSATALRVRVRAYRPARRAVIQASEAGGPTWFVKVVRPAAVSALRARHDLISPVLPVPPVLAGTPDGLVVFPQAAGRPVRALLDAGEPVPEAHTLEALLDALPAGLTGFPRRRSPLQRVESFAGVLRQTVDPNSSVLDGLDDIVAQLTGREARPAETVPVHGDFYEGQLLAEHGRVTGLLDVDTAGPGERADEWATLLAHLLTAAATTQREPVRRYAEAVLEHAQRRVEPVDLRRRTAAGLLGLATGPFRVQQARWPEHTAARVALARDWLAGG